MQRFFMFRLKALDEKSFNYKGNTLSRPTHLHILNTSKSTGAIATLDPKVDPGEGALGRGNGRGARMSEDRTKPLLQLSGLPKVHKNHLSQ